MDLEAAWYECSPYIYGIVGLGSLSNYESYLAIISGTVLLAASATIIRMRWTYRKIQAQQRVRDDRMKRVMKRKRQRKNTVEEDTIEDF